MTKTSRLVSRSTKGIGRFIVLAGALCLAVGVLRASSAQAQGVAAHGTWRSGVTDDRGGTWQLSASRSDGAFTGTLTATGPSDFGEGNVFGSMTDTGDMNFGVVYNDVEEASFTGSLNGCVVSGTYTTSKGDSGSWVGSCGSQ